jgi:hypothetical protein
MGGGAEKRLQGDRKWDGKNQIANVVLSTADRGRTGQRRRPQRWERKWERASEGVNRAADWRDEVQHEFQYPHCKVQAQKISRNVLPQVGVERKDKNHDARQSSVDNLLDVLNPGMRDKRPR